MELPSTMEKKDGKRKRKEHIEQTLAKQKKPSTSQHKKQKQKNTPAAGDVYLCNTMFTNTLPRIPADEKFLSYPFDDAKMYEYRTLSIEKKYQFKLHPEPDIGVTLDLIDIAKFKVTPGHSMAPEDARLFDLAKRGNQRKLKIGRGNKDISEIVSQPWMRKNEYMTNDLYVNVHNYSSIIEDEARVKARAHQEVKILEDIKPVKERIEDSFSFAQTTPVHPSKSHLTAVSVHPLLPNKTLMSNAYMQVIFSDDPTPVDGENGYVKTRVKPANVDKTEHAIISMLSADSKQVATAAFDAAYLLPPDDGPNDQGVSSYDFIGQYSLKIKLGKRLANNDLENEHEKFIITWDPNGGNLDGTSPAYYTHLRPEIGHLKRKNRLADVKEARKHNRLISRRELTNSEVEFRKMIIDTFEPLYDATGNDDDNMSDDNNYSSNNSTKLNSNTHEEADTVTDIVTTTATTGTPPSPTPKPEDE